MTAQTTQLGKVDRFITALQMERVAAEPKTPEPIDPELEGIINSLAEQYGITEIRTRDGLLLQAQDILANRRAAEAEKARRLEVFAQKAAIPRKFKAADLRTFTPFNAVQNAAFSQVRAWARKVWKGETPWLVLSGTCGTGKSMMACAALNSLSDLQGKTVQFVATVDLISAIQDSFKDGYQGPSEGALLRDLAQIDVLCLDDVAAAPSAFEAKELLKVLDARYRNELPTIIVSNLSTRPGANGVSELEAFLGNVAYSRIEEVSIFAECVTTDYRRMKRGNAM